MRVRAIPLSQERQKGTIPSQPVLPTQAEQGRRGPGRMSGGCQGIMFVWDKRGKLGSETGQVGERERVRLPADKSPISCFTLPDF